jgi:signal recognition particle receptor subunit beta
MKPTVKVIITGSSEADVVEFVSVLSETEVTERERKVPNPFSATKEEALLLPEVGRVEWNNMAVQMQALPAHKRYDFTWPTLLREVYGVVVLVNGDDTGEIDDTRHLLRLFGMMEQPNCLVAVKQQVEGNNEKLAEVQASLETTYPVIVYIPDGRESAGKVLRAWGDIVPTPEEPTRRRTRSSGGDRTE